MKLTPLFEHPDYQARHADMRKCRALYDCKHAVLSSFEYLWPHELELSEQPIKAMTVTGDMVPTPETVGARMRRIRSQRTRFLPIGESIISLWVSFMYGKDNSIELDDEAKKLFGEDEIQDVDGRGTSFEDFVKWGVGVNYFLYGNPIVLVDAPPITAETKAQQLADGWRPTMDVLDNLDVKDWQFFRSGKEKGKYKLVRWEYDELEDRATLEDEPTVVPRCRSLSLTDGRLTSTVYRLEKDSTLGAEKSGWKVDDTKQSDAPWTGVPVATIHQNESWLLTVADMILVSYNLMSAHWNGLNSQAFQRLFAIGKLQDKHAISLSEYAIGILPEGSDIKAIEPSNPESLVKAINASVDYVYRMALNRSRTLSTDSNEAPGADTLKEMREEMVTLLKSSLGEIEALMNRVLKFYAVYKLGATEGEKFRGKVVFNKDLTVDDFEKQVQIWGVARDDIKKVFSWYQAFLKKFAEEQHFPEDVMEEIEGEIDALKPEDVQNPLLGFRPFLEQGEDGGRGGQAEAAGGGSGRGDGGPGRGPRASAPAVPGA